MNRIIFSRSMTGILTKKTLSGLLILLLLGACSKAPESPGSVYDLEAGKLIAGKDCADCHGMDGHGTSNDIPNLAAQSAQYLIQAMHAYRDGGRLHAALQDMTTDMSETDIANVAGYYASQPAINPLNLTQNETSSHEKGKAIAASCEQCHGKKGISSTQGVPSLAGQQPAYLITSTLEYKNGSREHQIESEMMDGVDQVDIEKMAMYFASQTADAREAPPFGDILAGKAESAGCGKCHGRNGVSSKPMVPSLAGQDPYYLVKAIKSYHNDERHDEAGMPSRTDEQIENIAAYYSTRKIEASVESELTGEEMAAKCDRCHMPLSGKRKLNVPSLHGQNRDYLVKAIREYRGSDRDSTMMHKMSSTFSDENIETLASYYATREN